VPKVVGSIPTAPTETRIVLPGRDFCGLKSPPSSTHVLKKTGYSLAWTVSRDGSWVAFGANLGRLYYRELWLMGPDGGEARKLYEVDENSAIGGAEFSPEGQRLAYPKWH
jgi:hypothetical protein